MKTLLSFLFPQNKMSGNVSCALLLFRVAFGLLLAQHGWQKLMGFSMMSDKFPDPLGLGNELSLILAIFGELVCSLALVVGFLHRLVLIPMIFTMCVAFFIVHQGSIGDGELAFAYLVAFIILYIAGPGRISVDEKIAQTLTQEK